jgi:UDP-3-O-[3-hydroxymyristoyl] N-acetylglucosamine deacetylase
VDDDFDQPISFDGFDDSSVSGSELVEQVTASVLGRRARAGEPTQPHDAPVPLDSNRPVARGPDGHAAQWTLRSRISCVGRGVCSSAFTSLTLAPADTNTGIVFVRTDIRDRDPVISARWENVGGGPLRTTVANAEGVTVSTVSHLMAALYACQIDNARIELDGPEVPLIDGSADPFVFLIECAGTLRQQASRRAIQIVRTVTVREGRKTATLSPAAEPVFSVCVGESECLSFPLSPRSFKRELSRARRFRLLHQTGQEGDLRATRFGRLSDGATVARQRGLADDRLRYVDEFTRHRVLDAIGDLSLAGARVIGHFSGTDSDHALNNQLLRCLFAQEEAWRWIDLPAEEGLAAKSAGPGRRDLVA